MRFKEIERSLKTEGFVHIRTKGSHFIYYNAKTRRKASVPNHGSSDIAIGTLKKIEETSGVTLRNRCK